MSVYMKSQFSIRGMVWVYINNSSLTIYIFIDIHTDSDAEFKFLPYGTADKKDNNPDGLGLLILGGI